MSLPPILIGGIKQLACPGMCLSVSFEGQRSGSYVYKCMNAITTETYVLTACGTEAHLYYLDWYCTTLAD